MSHGSSCGDVKLVGWLFCKPKVVELVNVLVEDEAKFVEEEGTAVEMADCKGRAPSWLSSADVSR